MSLSRLSSTVFLLFLAIAAPVAPAFAAPTLPPPTITWETRRTKADTPGDPLLEQALEQAHQRRYESALKLAQQALGKAQKNRDRKGETVTLRVMATIYQAWGDFGRAAEAAESALKIAYADDDYGEIVNLLPVLGQSVGSAGNYGTALEIYQQYLEVLGTLKALVTDPDTKQQIYAEEGSALNILGNIYSVLGQYDKALTYYQEGLKIARQVGDREEEAESLLRMGTAYAYQDNASQALQVLNQGLKIAQETNNRRGEAALLSTLGNVAYYLQDKPSQALEFYQKVLAIGQELEDPIVLGDGLLNLGIVFDALGHHEKAIESLATAGKIAEEISSIPSIGTVFNYLGLASLNAGNLNEAESALQISIQAWETIRTTFQSDNANQNDANRVSVFDTQANTYDLLQRVMLAQKRPEAALEVAERGRARAFVELLSSRLSKTPTTRTQIGNPDLAAPALSIAQIQQIAKAQKATLVQYSIIYDDRWSRGKPKAKEAELFIWVVKPTGEITFRRQDLKPVLQASHPSLASLVSMSRDAIGVRGLSFQEDTDIVAQAAARGTATSSTNPQLQQLHQLLIQPIADLLPTDPDAHVIFVPQDSLFLVPFAALQDGAGKYLIEKHTVLVAPSIQVLDLTRQQRQKLRQTTAPEVLVMGNPTMPKLSPAVGVPPQPLSSLPGAEQEAKAIATLLKTQPLLGSQATKANILPKMVKSRIVHLATHGLLDDFQGSGVPGAIALAPTDQDNGLLTASEILDLKLQAELVVLSACDTGRGKITGDGVIGLSRSFMSAGVPSVLVSLWAVPDSPTATLMMGFYQELQRSPNKAQALRQAMLRTMQQYPDPKDWAAFTLLGEAE